MATKRTPSGFPIGTPYGRRRHVYPPITPTITPPPAEDPRVERRYSGQGPKPKPKAKRAAPKPRATPRRSSVPYGPPAPPSALDVVAGAIAAPPTTDTAGSVTGALTSGLSSVGSGASRKVKLPDIGPLFQPAFDEIERQRRETELTRESRLRDIDAFSNWYATKRAGTQAALTANLQANADAAKAADAASAQRIADLTAGTRLASGGSADLARLSGAQVGDTAAITGEKLAASRSAGSSLAAQAYQQRGAVDPEIAAARTANLRSGVEQRATAGLADINRRSSDLTSQKAKALYEGAIKQEELQQSYDTNRAAQARLLGKDLADAAYKDAQIGNTRSAQRQQRLEYLAEIEFRREDQRIARSKLSLDQQAEARAANEAKYQQRLDESKLALGQTQVKRDSANFLDKWVTSKTGGKQFADWLKKNQKKAPAMIAQAVDALANRYALNPYEAVDVLQEQFGSLLDQGALQRVLGRFQG